MSFKDTGRKSAGLVVSRNPTWLSNNSGLLISGVSGKSIVIYDILVSSGSGELGTSADAGGTKVCTTIQGANHFGISVPVPEDQSVYCSSALQYSYITVTYAIVDGIPAEAIPSPTDTLCIAGATNTGSWSADLINGDYDKEASLEADKVQYKTSNGSGWIYWTTWGGGYWVVAHDNGSNSYSWAYQSDEDVLLPYDVSTWSLATGAAGQGWGGTLSVDSGDCPAATTTTSAATTTTSVATTTTTVAAAASNACVAQTSGNEYYWDVDSTFAPVVGANAIYYSKTQYVNDKGTLWLTYNGTESLWKIHTEVNLGAGGSEWYASDNDGTNPWDAAWTNGEVGVTEKANATHCYPTSASNFCIAGQGSYPEYEGTWVPYNTYGVHNKPVYWNQNAGGIDLFMWYDNTNARWKINDNGWEPHEINGYSTFYLESDLSASMTTPSAANWSTEIANGTFDSIEGGDC